MWSMDAQRLTHITSPAATPDQLWQHVKATWSAVPQEHTQELGDNDGLRPFVRYRSSETSMPIRRMTASQLQSDLNAATGVLVSTDTIRRRLHKKGLYARRPIICVPLTPPQKRAKKLWCRQHVAWNPDEWRRVMFTDESRFSLNSDYRRVFVWREVGTRNNPPNMVERDPYRSQDFIVWAGIFLGGCTALHIFRQATLTGQRYRDEILAAYVMPQALEMGENFLLMDENARPHRAGVADTFIQNHAIARMNWPARSSDLNPIEHVWDNLGRRISSLQPPPRNTHELETALTQEWALIPQEQIISLILRWGIFQYLSAPCKTFKSPHRVQAVVVEAEWKAWKYPHKKQDIVALRKFREQIKVELGAKDGDRRFLIGLHGG
ncbi:hypothetical protein LAZ67_2005317 [Cordylochernes scorpioides]|uniref:Transposase Tc1-like domain-containing protein n=1 Tax=Cordylochernes scorpioides TaxID=51811 RepID=A0ABY6K8W2_9ARAC|nr:hypothetical protein LAZ67_2005317 [Cordylochernes scorpioides]